MFQKVKGSTLLETLIALVIILSISGVAASISVKAENENNVIHTVHAEILAATILSEIRTGKKVEVLDFAVKGYLVEKFTETTAGTDLQLIRIRILNPDGKFILEKKIYHYGSVSE